MALECPVCDVVAPDGEHLAHHLAVVAIARGGDHEAWLDEHAPGWAEREPADLAETAREHAVEVDHELDEAVGDADHDPLDPLAGTATDPEDPRRPGAGTGAAAGRDASRPQTAGDADLESILAAARELTREMQRGEPDDEATDRTETDSDE